MLKITIEIDTSDQNAFNGKYEEGRANIRQFLYQRIYANLHMDKLECATLIENPIIRKQYLKDIDEELGLAKKIIDSMEIEEVSNG